MSRTRLYLTNLPTDVTEEEIQKYMEGFGPVASFRLGHDRTYAFVQYHEEEDAQGLCRTAKYHRIMGADISVEYACNRPRERYAVIVSNIPTDLCWQQLKDFGRLAGGLVAFCDIDKSKRSRGFIEYRSLEEALDAVESLSGKNLGGQQVQLSADFDILLASDRYQSGSASFSRDNLPLFRSSRVDSPYALREHAEDGCTSRGHSSILNRGRHRSVSPWSRRHSSARTDNLEYGRYLFRRRSSSSVATHPRSLHRSASRHRQRRPPTQVISDTWPAVRLSAQDRASHLPRDTVVSEDFILDPYDDRAYTHFYLGGLRSGSCAIDGNYEYADPYAFDHHFTSSRETRFRSHAY
ncbi:hypothetical protein HDZ31DRAFT_47594 [Schizophyllum fasciatum]